MSLTLSLIQCAFSTDAKENFDRICVFLEEAHRHKSQVAVLPELCQGYYFCTDQDDACFSLAEEVSTHEKLRNIQKIAKKFSLVVPYPFFEKSGPHFYNSVAMIDADGNLLGVYRKSHIPDGPGYQEKFYFRPGNTGFMVFKTAFGKLGVGICWDQWFPEAARIMTLKGADLLIYPTAIGTEPKAPELSTKASWRRVMQGHAVANMIPVAASNRVGNENGQHFYGHSFVCDEFGDIVSCLENEEGITTALLDLEKAATHRTSFGFFRDRRSELYGELLE